MRILPLLLGLAAAGVAGTAAGGALGEAEGANLPKASPTRVTVGIDDFDFRPRTVVVRRGGRVTWVNREFANHTATVRRVGDTGSISEGERRSLAFRRIGRFHYVCDLHPGMEGTVVVRRR